MTHLSVSKRLSRASAREHAPQAVAELARLAREATSETARVAAIKELLDRAYGKSPQALTAGEAGEGTVKQVLEITWGGMSDESVEVDDV